MSFGFKLGLVFCLIFQSGYGFSSCSDPWSLLRTELPRAIDEKSLESLKGQLTITIHKEEDQIQVRLGELVWTLKLSELVSAYKTLVEMREDRLPRIWEDEGLGTQAIRAEYDFWVKKLYLQGELSLQPNRIRRIVHMMSHSDFLVSVATIVWLPLLTWYAGHAIHFTYFDNWNKFEKTFFHVNALSRTFGNLIRLDEIHYHNPKRSMAQLFWMVIFVSLIFQSLGTLITAAYGDPVYPQLSRAMVVALAVILYDIPISRWVHRFQFSNWISRQNANVTAKDIERSQKILEFGIQTFLRVSGTVVLQMMIYGTNRIFELTWPWIGRI